MQTTRNINWRNYSLIIILLAMTAICSFLSPNFLSSRNISNILKQVSIVTICAFAQGMIIISGGIDLSIGYLAGMAGSFSCAAYIATGNLLLAFIVGMILGAIVGGINGLFTAHFKLPPFIVTLAMQTVCFGAINLYTKGQNIYKIGGFNVLGQGTLFGFLPVTVAFMLLMLLITHILLKYSKFGRYLYAIGGNADATAAAGIQVERVQWAVYIISGIFASVAGMVMMGRLNAGMPGEGRGFETDAITATVIGSVIIGVLSNIMNLVGVDSYVQMIVKGLIIILAVLADSLSKQQRTGVRIMKAKK